MSAAFDAILAAVAANALLGRLASASIDLVIVTAIVALVAAFARIRSRRVIALLWLVALAKPVMSLAVGTPAPLLPIAAPPRSALSVPATQEFEIVREHVDDGAAVRSEERVIEAAAASTPGDDRATVAGRIALGAWLVGLAVMLGASLLDRIRLRRIIASSHEAGASVTAQYERLSRLFRPGRKPRVMVAPHLDSPALAGTFRPVILLPEWMVESKQVERMEWSLRHELSHWSSRDPLANLLAEVARALFFFHPAAWWAARRWKEAMEMACDQSVVVTRRDVKRYAAQLYQILTHVDSHPNKQARPALMSSLFATRTQIGRRIETLLRPNMCVGKPGTIAMVLISLFAATSFAVGTNVVPAPPSPPTPADVEVVAEAPVARDSDTTGRVIFQRTTDESDVHIEAQGPMSFKDYVDFEIRCMSPHSYFMLEEKTSKGKRMVRITGADDESVRYDYRVNDRKAEWNEDARRWLLKVLRDYWNADHCEVLEQRPAPRVAVEPIPHPIAEAVPTPVAEPAPRAVPEPASPPVPVTE